MRTHATVLLAASLALLDSGQRNLPSTSGLLQRVSVAATADPDVIAPGGVVTLRLEIKPQHNVRVFAPGAKQFTPVFVALTVPKGTKAGIPRYDIPEEDKNPGNKKKVPVYKGTFHINHALTVRDDVRPGTQLLVRGLLTYQVCDTKKVYPKRTIPVTWSIVVAQPDSVPPIPPMQP